jgi:hypothetical protein
VLSNDSIGYEITTIRFFKGKPGKTLEKNANAANGYSPNASIAFKKAWNDSGAMLKWIELVLKPSFMK